jgi:S1-C subfamily serine protease
MDRFGKVLGVIVLCGLLATAGIAGAAIVDAASSGSAAEKGPATAQVKAIALAEDTAQTQEENGILIASVRPDSPADQAGVVRGDILLEVNGEPVNDWQALRDQLSGLSAGDQVDLTVLHGDEQRTLTATVPEGDDQSYLGLVPCGGFGLMDHLGRFGMGEMPALPAVSGALVTSVVADSPAEQAGLQEGDRIVAVDGQEVNAENSLADLIGAHAPGDQVTLEIERATEETQEVTVQLGENPDNAGTAYLGVQYAAGGVRGPEQFFDRTFPMLPEGVTQGVIVRSVTDGSPAQQAGLQSGDAITAIDGEAVSDPQSLVDAVAAHQPGDTVTLTVSNADTDGEQEIQVTLGENPDEAGKAYMGISIGGVMRSWHPDGSGSEMPQWLQPFRRFLEPPQTQPQPEEGLSQG